MSEPENQEVKKQQPLGGVRIKILMGVAIVAIIVAAVFFIITLTKSDGSPDGTPSDDGMAVVSLAWGASIIQ